MSIEKETPPEDTPQTIPPGELMEFHQRRYLEHLGFTIIAVVAIIAQLALSSDLANAFALAALAALAVRAWFAARDSGRMAQHLDDWS